MIVKNESKTYDEYKKNIGLRKLYYLYKCTNGSKLNHAYELSVPRGYQDNLETVQKIYGLNLDFSVRDCTLRYLPLVFRCLYCNHFLYTRPKICKKCHKFFNPVPKKVYELLIIKKETLICQCYEKN